MANPKPKGRDDFLREYARQVLAEQWCPTALSNGGVIFPVLDAGSPFYEVHQYALMRGWISRKDNVTILTPGWEAAAAYLRR